VVLAFIYLQQSSQWIGLLPMLLIFAIFYFLLFMPMQRERKRRQKMLNELQSGQNVVTNGGVIGTVVALNDDQTVVIRVKPDGVKLLVGRSAIASLADDPKKK
jgi:preprotein translocase subunit YajC